MGGGQQGWVSCRGNRASHEPGYRPPCLRSQWLRALMVLDAGHELLKVSLRQGHNRQCLQSQEGD